MCSLWGMIEQIGRTEEVNSLKITGKKWSLSHTYRPKKNYINMFQKGNIFYYLQGKKFLNSCRVPNIFLSWKCQQGSGRCLGKTAHFYAHSASPLGDSISIGCTGVVFGTWGVSQETTANFWWYRGYYSLNKCFSMLGVREEGVAVVEESLCRFRKSHRLTGLTLKKEK